MATSPPFAYYGGKTRIAGRIAELLPEHLHYVEPFAGGLSVLLAKTPSRMETVNDLDGDLMCFWRVLRERPDDLVWACALTPHRGPGSFRGKSNAKPPGLVGWSLTVTPSPPDRRLTLATQVFSEAELAQLRAFPDTISSQELIRYFTLVPADIEFIERRRGAANRLGVAVQLCALPWLGYVPTDLTTVPAPALGRLSEKLRIPIGELRAYGTREQTRSDHLREVAHHIKWRSMKEPEAKELETYLLARAMEHDSPSALFRAACAHQQAA